MIRTKILTQTKEKKKSERGVGERECNTIKTKVVSLSRHDRGEGKSGEKVHLFTPRPSSRY